MSLNVFALLWYRKNDRVIQFNRMSGNLKGACVLMFAAANFAIMAALIKLAGTNLHVTQILFLRQIGMLILIFPSLVGNFPSAFRTRRLSLQLARLCIALVAMLFGFTAIIHMPLADATAIGFAKSFFVTIFAVWLLQEKVGVHRWSAVVVGFLGVMIMLRPGTEVFSVYSVYALIGAAAAGVVMVIIRLLSRVDDAVTILVYQALGVAIFMLIPAIVYWQTPTAREWWLLGGIGIVSFLAQKANIYAYKWGEASLMASLDYVRLLYATSLGLWLFGHVPDRYTWIGALVITLASIYTVQREVRLRRSLTSAPDSRPFANH